MPAAAFAAPLALARVAPRASGPARGTVPARAPRHAAPSRRRAPRAGLLADKYGAARGADIEPVSDAVARFARTFAKPVPVVYRGIVNEVIVSTHLARVCALWRYCSVFALGLDDVFAELLKSYPDEDEKTELVSAVMAALCFDGDKIRADAQAVRDWCDGKTEADVFAAAKSGEGPVGAALKAAREGDPAFEWYYSRMFGIGLVRVMAAVGAELSVAAADAWGEELGLTGGKLSVEMGTYLSVQERMKMAEQMFAEVAARDARKTAERLAEKAKAAEARAARIEAGEDVDEFTVNDTTAESAEVAAPVGAKKED